MNIYDKLYDPDGIDYGKTKSLGNMEAGTERERVIEKKLAQVIGLMELASSASVLEIGASMGFNHRCHPGYTGIEYSEVAVAQARQRFGTTVNVLQGDVTCLKFPDEAFNFVFSFSTLEHVPKIEKAFEEIARVLKTGGVAYLSPAWNCRTWTVDKIDVIPYRDLTVTQKAGKFLIPVRDSIIFRFSVALPRRLLDELFRSVGLRTKLRYRALQPRMALIEKYGHIPDDDAFVSMDSHSAMIWFLDKGFHIDSHSTFLRRILCRGEAIVIRKGPRGKVEIV